MASDRAVASPTSRIPKAYKNRGKRVCLAACKALTRFSADFCPILSRPAIASALSRNRSAGFLIMPLSTICSTSLSPRPSISIALREAKCLIASLRWAAQNRPPLQRETASPSSRSTSEPQIGHCVGITNSDTDSGRFDSMTLTISGMTSPARRTITVSPICTSLRRISSSLCRVALETVTPPTNTGFKRATGVKAPVRPTWTSMSSTTVISSCAGNL